MFMKIAYFTALSGLVLEENIERIITEYCQADSFDRIPLGRHISRGLFMQFGR
jgi:hypothetical protein